MREPAFFCHFRQTQPGLTLIELLTVIAVVAVLAGILVPTISDVRERALHTESASNIRQLATANLACAADTGHYVQAMDAQNNHWHGSVESGSRFGGTYDGKTGFLSPYLEGGAVRMCPVLEAQLEADGGTNAFNQGTGGYGYNAAYLGSSPHRSTEAPSRDRSRGEYTSWRYTPNTPARVPYPSDTVMFTSTAIASGNGIVEYGFSEPYFHISGGRLQSRATPSVHFRFGGKALVAWADGHVSFVSPNGADASRNAYGDDNEANRIGWFGPEDNNGLWNPAYRFGRPF